MQMITTDVFLHDVVLRCRTADVLDDIIQTVTECNAYTHIYVSYLDSYHRNLALIYATTLLKLLLLHQFNGVFSRTTWYQKGKTSLY